MKLISAVILLASSCAAFMPGVPKAFMTSSTCDVQTSQLYADKVPFFASEEGSTAELKNPNEMTEEEEVEMLVQAEVKKSERMSNLRNAKGVDYAPWMKISEEDEKQIRQLMKEKTAARRAREEQERNVSGNLYFDSQAQELSGTGLKSKIIDGQVELEWATKSEKGTKGFVVSKRPAKTDDFSVIATYDDWGPLMSQGEDGGIYRYFDESTAPGGWVYRISEVDINGSKSDICQCLVEIQTEEEQKSALFAGVGFALLAVIAGVGGILLDPMNGY